MAMSRSTRSSPRGAISSGIAISAEAPVQEKAAQKRQIQEQAPPGKRAKISLQLELPPDELLRDEWPPDEQPQYGSPQDGHESETKNTSQVISIASPTSPNHPVDPRTTSTPLTTPHDSRYTAFPPPLLTSPINSSSHRTPASTTTSPLAEGCTHLIATEPKLAPVIARFPCTIFSAKGLSQEVEPFQSLASGIIGQQVSGAAASAIQRRFVALFDPKTITGKGSILGGKYEDAAGDRGPFPTPEAVMALGIDKLRLAGLSKRKSEYIYGLAEKFANGELNAKWLVQAPYEEVVEKLTAVRGLGLWSVEMFACFGLKRMDVFSVGDLGVQRGLAAVLGKDVKKLKAKGGKWKYASEKEMLDYASKFAPYRSLLMWYLWRYEGVDTAVMEGS